MTMETLTIIAQVWLLLMLSIAIHESGHLLAAWLFGMRVERVMLGTGPALVLETTRGDLRLGILPVAGSVAIAGIDASWHTPVHPGDFRVRPRWQRITTILAGPIVQGIGAWIMLMLVAMSAGAHGLAQACTGAWAIIADLPHLMVRTWHGEAEAIITGAWSWTNIMHGTALVAGAHAGLNLVPSPTLDGGRALRQLMLRPWALDAPVPPLRQRMGYKPRRSPSAR